MKSKLILLVFIPLLAFFLWARGEETLESTEDPSLSVLPQKTTQKLPLPHEPPTPQDEGYDSGGTIEIPKEGKNGALRGLSSQRGSHVIEGSPGDKPSGDKVETDLRNELQKLFAPNESAQDDKKEENAPSVLIHRKDSEANSATVTKTEVSPAILRSGGGGGDLSSAPSRSDLANIATPTETPSETPTPSPTPSFVSGQPRGYTMLYAMQPEAHATVESEIEIILESQVRQVVLGILTDGTFGWNPRYVGSLLERLNKNERHTTLVLYLSNGPTQRILDDSPIVESFPQMNVERFREAIRYDPSTREAFRDLARRVVPLFAFHRQLNRSNTNIVVPMLEDNLDAESYAAIRTLTEEILGGLALIVRNPCPGCYEGNDMARLGGPLELHGRENVPFLQPGDAFSLDGSGYYLASETGTPTGFHVNDLESLFNAFSQINLRYVGLWRHDRQGLENSSGPSHPKQRLYAVPSLEHHETEKILLRLGLQAEQ
jgi:hypothetical protein